MADVLVADYPALMSAGPVSRTGQRVALWKTLTISVSPPIQQQAYQRWLLQQGPS